MDRHWIRPLLACAAWLPATAALAVGEPPKVVFKPAPPEGTPAVAPPAVEATQPTELRKQTYSFVDTFATGSPKLDQISRWGSELCVSVQGLPSPDENAKVKTRVEDVAKALGVRAAGRTCAPNLEIKFSNQPQGFLDQVAATHEDMLGYWHRRDRETLKSVIRPVQAWYRTATLGTGNIGGSTFAFVDTGGGDNGAGAASGGAAGRQASGEIIDDPDARAPTGCAGNKFSACLRSTFNHVLVMVDTNAVKGVPAGLLTDYIVVLSLSQPRSLDGCNALKSVIDIFATGCAGRAPPDGLTRADVAYLTSLYKTDPEAKRASQQTDVAGRMADMLLKANATDRLVRQQGKP